MDSSLSADAILAQVPQAHTKSAAGKRKLESAVVFIATIASLATGVIGFVDAYQQPGKQNFLLGLGGCAVVLLLVRFMQWRRRFAAHVPYIAAQTQVAIGSDFLELLAARVRVSRIAHLITWFVRKLDNLAWLLLVSALSLSAGAVFVLSAFGLYTAYQNQLDVIDFVLLIGLVRPLRSAVSGIQRFRRQSTGSRQRVQTFSKSFHYAVESVHVYIDKLSQSTVGVLNASASAANKVSVGLATTASTVAISVAVSGVGLASAHVAPQAVIATGEVIPLPPAVVQFAGPEGREAEIRGAVFYGCVGSLLDNAQPADEQCQTAVQQSNDSCLGWEGGALPPECANALSGVLPQVMDSIESTSPPVPPDTPSDTDGQSGGLDPAAAASEQKQGGTQLPQRVNAAGTAIPQGTPTPCDRTRVNAQCPLSGASEAASTDDSGMQTERTPGQTNGLPPFDGTQGPRSPDGTQGPRSPDGTQGPRSPDGTQGPRSPEGTPGMPLPPPDGTQGRLPPLDGTPGPQPPPPLDGTPGPQPPPPLDGTPGPQPPRPDGTQGPPPPPDGTQAPPPPRATDAPPPPRATDGPPPPRATDVPPPRATDVPPPRATDVPPPRATDVPPPRATDVPPPRATDGPRPTRRPPFLP